MATNRYLLRAGLKAVVVVAEDAADAKAVAKAAMVNDTNSDWDAAVVTDVAAAAAGADMEGWRLNVKVDTPADVEVYNITVTAGAADTVNDMGDDAVLALEAAGGALITPSYATPNLTIAAIADNIGDHKVYVTMMPPLTWPDPAHVVPGFIGAIVDEGIAGAVLTCALVPAQCIPAVVDSILAPAVTDVRLAAEYGTGGDGSTGTCNVPAAADVEFGVAVDATTGTFVVPAVADVQTAVTFGAAAEFTGTFAAPAAGDVRLAVGYGAAGAEFTGTCNVPAAADVEFGVAVDATTGTFVVPAVADVQTAVTFGAAAEFTGTFAAPAVTDVRDGTTFGAAAEFTGTMTLPAVTAVHTGIQYGAAGVEFTGTLTHPLVTDVRTTVQYGAGGTELTGTLALPNVADVQSGVGFGAAGTEFSGTFVVPAIASVHTGVTYGAAAEFTGTLTHPAVTDVRATVQYGAGGTELTGTLALPAEADVEEGVDYGAAGTEFTGTFVVPAEANVELDVTYGDSDEFTGSSTPGEHCFLVQLDETAKTEINKVNTLVVAADSEDQALEMAQAYQSGDSNGAWVNATVDQAVVATSMEDWELNIMVIDLTTDPLDHEVEYDVTVTGGVGDKLTDLGDAMAAALVVDGLTSSFVGSTLTVSTVGDNIGNREVRVTLYPPNSEKSLDTFIGSITDQGIAGAALTVGLETTKYIPAVRGAYEEH